jgi:hypothetical protein
MAEMDFSSPLFESPFKSEEAVTFKLNLLNGFSNNWSLNRRKRQSSNAHQGGLVLVTGRVLPLANNKIENKITNSSFFMHATYLIVFFL